MRTTTETPSPSKPSPSKPSPSKPTTSKPSPSKPTPSKSPHSAPLDNGIPATKCSAATVKALASGAAAVVGVDPDVAVGIAVISRDDPKCTATYNAEETFPTASVVKLLIAIDVLRARRNDADTTERVEHMLAVSDDSIASMLWADHGAGDIIISTKSLINLPSLSPPASPEFWGWTRIDAIDVARIWRYILDEAPSYVRTPILVGTGGAKETAADGFDQYFGIPDGLRHATWWIKQGWGTSNGRRVVNTTGIVGKHKDSIVVMLTSHPLEVGYPEATDSVTRGIAALAGAVGEA
ncbi:MAG: hypothetical protein ACR2F6_18435 [Mycobacteriales bacterium]